ncbi:MAG: tetratricopeptide repeat protein, partial [Pseudomonadota bacterium]
MDRRVLIIAVGLLLLGGWPAWAMAADACEPWAAKLVSLQGRVEIKAADAQAWQAAKLDAIYCPGDTLQVGANSRAAVVLPNETLLRLDQNTVITLTTVEPEAESLLDMLKGLVHFISRTPRSLKVKTPYVNAAIEGTEFVVESGEGQATVTVFEGTVLAQNEQGEVRLTDGERATVQQGQAPVKVAVVRPRDAVQWAVYYPPVIDPFKPDDAIDGAAGGAVRDSRASFEQGDIEAALLRLDDVPVGMRDSGFYAYRASLLLYVGRVDDAKKDIDQALAQNPSDANAMSLQSIVALVQGDRDRAMQLAVDATKAQPDAAAPQIAMSYAQQAHFDLRTALQSAQKATQLEPDNALAHARVAELELSEGRLGRAVDAAARSAELNPKLARSQWVLGFAYLTRVRINKAIATLERAVKLDPADPMARLGLGLARIRKGKLEEGRREIEIAATLDPNNAIIRAYLGKAYYEEKRDELAGTQYDMAKGLDPNDPTAFFYDAIRKQTDNRPVEALEDIQTSIALNDNRAVYRSSLLLDQDEAARSASRARIYQDLGFEQLALADGYNSLNADPSSHSAHRFLADAHAGQPRQEAARVSELLQSQLLQPINTTPIQPQLAEGNLQILEGSGPAEAGFNEFNPLYTSNGGNVQIDGVVGSRNTLGNSLVFSLIEGPFSLSLGQFHYETDGYRPNNDLTEDVYNVFGQWAATPQLNLQAEWRRRETDQGDLEQNFDPTDFSETDRRKIKRDMKRFGLRYSPAVHSDLIFSYIDARRDGEQAQIVGPIDVDEKAREEGD